MNLLREFKKTFKEAASITSGDIRSIYSSYSKTMNSFGFGKRTQLGTLSISGILLAGTAIVQPEQALGVLAVGAYAQSRRFKNNRHAKAGTFTATSLFAAQMLLMGAWVGAIQFGAGAVRSGLLTAIGEQSRSASVVVGGAAYGAAIGLAAHFNLVTSPISLAPLLALGAVTLADTLKDSFSHSARALRGTGAVGSLVYQFGMAGSVGIILAETIGLAMLGKAIYRYDVGVESGKPIRERFSNYAKSLLQKKPTEAVPNELRLMNERNRIRNSK